MIYMAVQAQYPSNVFLLNSRNSNNGQEGQEYSSQPPQLLLEQNHAAALGTTTNNSLKRGRGNVLLQSTVINPILSHLIHLPPHQQNVVSTGLTLSFHHKQEASHSSSFLSQIKQHQHEIDQYLRSQEEQLWRTLAEKRQMHYRQLLTAAEEMMAQKLREKEAQVVKATRKNSELEARAAQLKVEAQVWQAKARAQEAAAASLQAQLQQTIMLCHRGGENSSGGGGLSSGAAVEGHAEDAGSAYVDPARVMETEEVARRKCKACGKRIASVVVLPCRHLCICTECDVHLRACPFCLTVKNSTVQVSERLVCYGSPVLIYEGY